MAILNLLKASYTGRLGETVGASWKGLPVLRTYAKPTYTRTAAQDPIRTVFHDMQQFCYLFTDQLKTYTALNLRQKSLRNAITKLNKGQFTTGTFSPALLLVSDGGLLSPTAGTIAITGATSTVNAAFTYTSVAPFTAKALVVGVAVNTTQKLAGVATAPLTASGTVTITLPTTTGDNVVVYLYTLDYHGYRKIASRSVYATQVGAHGADNKKL